MNCMNYGVEVELLTLFVRKNLPPTRSQQLPNYRNRNLNNTGEKELGGRSRRRSKEERRETRGGRPTFS